MWQQRSARDHSVQGRSTVGADVARSEGADERLPVQRTLFRQEVLEYQQYARQWGRVVPLQPLPVRLTSWLMVCSLAAAMAFLFVGHYARKETATGYLTPAVGIARVFASQPGTVRAVYVAQNQTVVAGQPLIAVATDQTTTKGEDVNASILATLSNQKQALTQQIATEVRRTASERERIAAQLQSAQNELVQLGKQADVQTERIRVLEMIVASGAQLRLKGLVSELDQNSRMSTVLDQRRALVALEQEATKQRSEIADKQFNLDQLQFTQAEKIRSLQNDLSGVDQRIAEVTGKQAYVVRAPIAGRISLLQASVGQAVDPQKLQLTIVPTNSSLQAELFVPARAIGFVQAGQEVRVLYDAFPYQQFGTYRGRITSVSHSVLLGNDVVTPVPLKDPSYKVTVALDRPDVDAYGKKVPLQPDMLLKADIVVEKRTLVQWLLNPLLSVRMRG